jgi:hypothetical protein
LEADFFHENSKLGFKVYDEFFWGDLEISPFFLALYQPFLFG